MEKEAINRAIREATGIDRDDFDSDLNAMHSAELWLARNRPELENAYDLKLAKVTHGLNAATSGGQPSFYVTLLRRATAAQRAEAMCRVLCPERWKD